MTRDDIIRMAHEADFPFNKYGLIGCSDCEQDVDAALERVIVLAVAEKDKEIKRLQDLLYTQLGELTALRAEKQMREKIKVLKEMKKDKEIERLRKALARYGIHGADCTPHDECKCGLETALQEQPR